MKVDLEIECVFTSNAVLQNVRERKLEQGRQTTTIAALVAEPDGEDWAVKYLLAQLRLTADRILDPLGAP